MTGPIDYLRMVLAGEVASAAVLRKATAALDAIQDELEKLQDERAHARLRAAKLDAAGRVFLTQIQCNGPHGQYVAEFRAALDARSAS